MNDNLHIYEERSLSMCIEATFDFIRSHTKAWLRLGGVLFLPVCALLAMIVFGIDNEKLFGDFNWGVETFFFEVEMSLFQYLLMVIGIWAVLILVYTLVFAQRDNVQSADIRSLLPYVRQTIFKSLVSAVMLFIVLWAIAGMKSWIFVIVSVIFFVPLMLVPPVWMLEDDSRANAIVKGLRLGFSSWFSLFFMILIVMLINFVLILVINVPWLAVRTILTEIVPVREGNSGGLFFLKSVFFLFMVLELFCCYMMSSMVLLSCVFHYGSVSEKVDDTSLESDIDHFEQL